MRLIHARQPSALVAFSHPRLHGALDIRDTNLCAFAAAELPGSAISTTARIACSRSIDVRPERPEKGPSSGAGGVLEGRRAPGGVRPGGSGGRHRGPPGSPPPAAVHIQRGRRAGGGGTLEAPGSERAVISCTPGSAGVPAGVETQWHRHAESAEYAHHEECGQDPRCHSECMASSLCRQQRRRYSALARTRVKIPSATSSAVVKEANSALNAADCASQTALFLLFFSERFISFACQAWMSLRAASGCQNTCLKF